MLLGAYTLNLYLEMIELNSRYFVNCATEKNSINDCSCSGNTKLDGTASGTWS